MHRASTFCGLSTAGAAERRLVDHYYLGDGATR